MATHDRRRKPQPTSPLYGMGARCANCDGPFAFLLNGTDLNREESQIPTVLASCTCIVVAYAEDQVRQLPYRILEQGRENNPTLSLGKADESIPSLSQDHDLSHATGQTEDPIEAEEKQ